jgi:hypothetical protein
VKALPSSEISLSELAWAEISGIRADDASRRSVRPAVLAGCAPPLHRAPPLGLAAVAVFPSSLGFAAASYPPVLFSTSSPAATNRGIESRCVVGLGTPR